MTSLPEANPPQDWDEACHAVSDAYFPHTLTPLSKDDATHTFVNAVELGPVVLAKIGWGADVAVASDHPGAYAVNIPMSGHIESVSGGEPVYSSNGMATICPPDTSTRIIEWTKSCAILGVKLDRDYLSGEMTRVFARPGMQLPPQVDLRNERGASWLEFVRSVATQAQGDQSVLRNKLVSDQLAGAITSAFLLAAVHDDEVAGAVVRPRIVKRVIDRMQADPARAWTAADMAEVAGISVRRLQEGFREYVGMSPMEYLRELRLERVYADLSEGGPGLSVTDVAMRWGLMHTGRFAAAFRRKYGMSPSEALRGT